MNLFTRLSEELRGNNQLVSRFGFRAVQRAEFLIKDWSSLAYSQINDMANERLEGLAWQSLKFQSGYPLPKKLCQAVNEVWKTKVRTWFKLRQILVRRQ